MRFARIAHGGVTRFVRLVGSNAVVLDRPPWQPDIVEQGSVPFREDQLEPAALPSKIVAIGRNYRAHAKELGNDVPVEPLLFLKPPSALLRPGGTIVRPRASSRVEHEAELAVVIGKRARRVSEADALSHVFG